MKILVNDKDISNLMLSGTWSGDLKQSTRQFSMGYLYKADSGLPEVVSKVGDTVALYDENSKLRFIGIIRSESHNLQGGNINIDCVDIAWYLLKNKATGGAYKGTASEITTKVCGEFNIEVGSCPPATELKTVISVGDKTIYQVIQEAWGEGYYIFADDTKISIEALGTNAVAVLSGHSNVSDIGYKSSIENMINQIRIIDENGNIKDTINNSDDLKYGLMQEVYKESKDKDSKKEASLMLKSVENGCNIEVPIGNWECKAGRAVYIEDTDTGMIGLFRITDDKHNFSGNSHSMSLGLEVI